MGCDMGCGSDCNTEHLEDDKKFQNLRIWENKGISRGELSRKLKEQEHAEVRVYTVATTRLVKDSIKHIGSGPNLEGGLVTLCTCKHSMRQYHTTDEWEGKWILGLTSRAKTNGFSGSHYLFYMMKVAKSFESHAELYKYMEEKNLDALRLKNAVKNRLGDIFEPDYHCGNPLDPSCYKQPHRNHSHGINGAPDWHDDIIYNGKSVPLLLGDEVNTFVWTKPTIIFDKPRNNGNMKLTLGDLCSSELAFLRPV